MRSLVWFAVAVIVAAACSETPSAATRQQIATLSVVAQPAGSLAVLANVGKFSVRATDSSGAAVPGAFVSFTLSRGSGRVTARADTTDATGLAETTLILGSTTGAHTVLAASRDVPPVESGIVTAIPGPTARIAISTSLATLSATQDSVVVTATPQDAQGNTTGAQISWTSRNAATLVVSSNNISGSSATARAQTRPAETWVVATSGTAADSLLVRVNQAGASPCAFVASPAQLAVGAALPFQATGSACLSTPTTAEYLVVAHYNTTVNSVGATVNLLATGISAPGSTYPDPAPRAEIAAPEENGFELRLREAERRELPGRMSSAREWARTRRPAIRAALKEGDQVPFNTNPSDFCANPSPVPARVAAITQSAIILTDTQNPPGGFSDEEYRAIGATLDTLVYPVDTATFGAPTDIDGNGKVIVLFTKAVNAITPRGSQGAVLGFFFSRDLLPRSSTGEECAGSNVAEMFYVMVPDPTAVVSDARSKAFVSAIASATIAHELQHLINSSRRIYVNNASSSAEELWLNEGLSHIAEELVFYRASKLSPRQNLDSATIRASGQSAMLDLYQQGNFRRYQQYLRSPDANAPMAENDLLATRGAAWSFLRYVADRSRTSDGDFWKRLANSSSTGARNLESVLQGSGVTVLQLLEEWSRAVATDDIVPGSTAQHPSWSFVTAMPYAGYSFALAPSVLANGAPFTVTIRGSSSFYGRLAVAAGQQALVQVTGQGGGTIPRGMRLTIVRIK